jgi:serine/threonine-protein kinase
MLKPELAHKVMLANVTQHSVAEKILCPICRAVNRPDARFCQQCGNDVLLDNIYRITKVIKEGGMGVVYQAIDEDGEVYAVKEMHDRFTNTEDREEGIERFIDEAKLLRTLRGHPNIPNVYRSFIDEGRYYLSMEFIFGEDLEDVLKRQQRFPEPQVLQWADELCDVLEFMHARGLIYRDMKPSNVMITRDGKLKVVDFGIAKLLQPGQRGTMVGTPGYAPPEQYQGLVTPQSDVYALAATLHHLLTGRDPRDEPPFSFPPARQLRPDISVRTSQVLDKALQMELGDRYPTVGAFRAALPIPTGEQRPTRMFDPQPRSEPARRAQPVPPPTRPQPAPRPQPVPPPPRPAQAAQPRQQAAPARRRRGGFGRAVRRLIATGAIATGLYFGALQYAPETVAAVETYVTTAVQEYLAEPAQPAPEPANVPALVDPIQMRSTVTVDVVENASQEVIINALRQRYLELAQERYPGAQLLSSRLPATVGPPDVTPLGGGYQRIAVEMDGFVVPAQ